MPPRGGAAQGAAGRPATLQLLMATPRTPKEGARQLTRSLSKVEVVEAQAAGIDAQGLTPK